MSNGLNASFRTDTKKFLKKYFLTAVGIERLSEGSAPFDLVLDSVQDQPVALVRTVNLLEAREQAEPPLLGYWVPQGASTVVPVAPGARQVVFTPDFSGCAIMVDQINANNYRVYHVQGGSNYCAAEYLNDPARSNVMGMAASMTFDDYGDAAQPRGFAFLKYEQGRWWIYQQRHTGAGLGFSGGRLVPIGGAQHPRGGARVPVVDLGRETPRLNARQNGFDLPVVRNIGVQRAMAPNDELWDA